MPPSMPNSLRLTVCPATKFLSLRRVMVSMAEVLSRRTYRLFPCVNATGYSVSVSLKLNLSIAGVRFLSHTASSIVMSLPSGEFALRTSGSWADMATLINKPEHSAPRIISLLFMFLRIYLTDTMRSTMYFCFPLHGSVPRYSL